LTASEQHSIITPYREEKSVNLLKIDTRNGEEVMINIHRATIEDENRVISLLQQLISPSSEYSTLDRQTASATFRQIVTNEEKGTMLLAEQDGEAVGLITLSYPVALRCGGVYTCIEEFIVSEQARGKGVGGQLFEVAVAEATDKGCFELQVNNPSEMGYPLYLRHGMKDVGKHLNLKLPRQAL